VTERLALARPSLPSVAERARWPGTVVAIFGRGAAELAARIAERLRELEVPVRVIRVELRRAEGSLLDGDASSEAVLHAHPDALVSALSALADAAPAVTLGVGAAFAAAVEADPSVWITEGESLAAMAPAERRLASEARLVLSEPRPRAAVELAERIAARAAGHAG
jgi:hypothetical protein